MTSKQIQELMEKTTARRGIWRKMTSLAGFHSVALEEPGEGDHSNWPTIASGMTEADAIACSYLPDIAQTALEALQRVEELESVLADMTNQFAYEGTKDGVPVQHTGGLSSLERAFRILNWTDPKPNPYDPS